MKRRGKHRFRTPTEAPHRYLPRAMAAMTPVLEKFMKENAEALRLAFGTHYPRIKAMSMSLAPMTGDEAVKATDNAIRMHIMETGRLPWLVQLPRHVYAALFLCEALSMLPLFAAAPVTTYRGLQCTSNEADVIKTM